MAGFSLLIQYFSRVNRVILSFFSSTFDNCQFDVITSAALEVSYGRDIIISNGDVRSMLIGSFMNAVISLA